MINLAKNQIMNDLRIKILFLYDEKKLKIASIKGLDKIPCIYFPNHIVSINNRIMFSFMR